MTAYSQNRLDIIIDEIMPDPSPSVGLPNYEWIELKNLSNTPINLHNWRLGDGSGISGNFPAYTLPPDSFLIICSNTALPAMSIFGPALAIPGFPSLDNEGELIYLRAPDGRSIHAVEYASHWYHDDTKKEGGWSLEMIDTRLPCMGAANWIAATNDHGGSPGKKNAGGLSLQDSKPPLLLRSYSIDSNTIVLAFDEPLDSSEAVTLPDFAIDGGIKFLHATCLPPLFTQIALKTNQALAPDFIYTVSVTHVKDCNNNTSVVQTTRTGIPLNPEPGDWIINEILFNPRPNGYDFVECYNHSNKILDASKLAIASRSGSGNISMMKPLSAKPIYIFPGDHIVITENADILRLNYLVSNPGSVLELPSLPGFPDDTGCVVLLNFQGVVTDELHYSERWHFSLITDREGISLERIDPSGISQDAKNWHSAASTAGFATPTIRNSQFRQPDNSAMTFTLAPKVFSPDNDGRDDIVLFHYELDVPGFVANCRIFDGAGRQVKYLVRNAVLGRKGYWTWDGLDDLGAKLPVGIYVVVTEIFNLQARRQHFKNCLVLARPLR